MYVCSCIIKLMITVLHVAFLHTCPAGQDAVNEKKMKLDYEEITPCLKEVTKQWDKLIALPNRAHTIIPYEEINKLFKEGNFGIKP